MKKYNAKKESERENSAMWRHTKEHHSGIRGPQNGARDYRMWVVNSWNTPVDRQISEGHDIGDLEDEFELGKINIMNSKSDFSQKRKVSL